MVAARVWGRCVPCGGMSCTHAEDVEFYTTNVFGSGKILKPEDREERQDLPGWLDLQVFLLGRMAGTGAVSTLEPGLFGAWVCPEDSRT